MSARNEPHWGEISLLNWVSPVLWNKAKTNQPQNDHSTPNSHRAHQLHSLLLVGVASSPVKLPAGQGKPRLHPLTHRADLKRCVLKLPGPCGGGGGRGDTLGGLHLHPAPQGHWGERRGCWWSWVGHSPVPCSSSMAQGSVPGGNLGHSRGEGFPAKNAFILGPDSSWSLVKSREPLLPL